jgi:hypothetical protein
LVLVEPLIQLKQILAILVLTQSFQVLHLRAVVVVVPVKVVVLGKMVLLEVLVVVAEMVAARVLQAARAIHQVQAQHKVFLVALEAALPALIPAEVAAGLVQLVLMLCPVESLVLVVLALLIQLQAQQQVN